MLLVAATCWGLSFPLIKAVSLLHWRLLPEAGPWFSPVYTVAPRFVLATLFLLACRPLGFWKITRSELVQGVVLGVFAAGGMLLQNDGLQYAPASTVAFLTQLTAILIPVCLAVWRRRNPGWRIWVACALVLAGVAVLGRFDWHALRLGRGEAETVLCALFFTAQIIWLGRADFAANRPWAFTLAMFATLAVVFSMTALVVTPDLHALTVPWRDGAWLGFTAAITVFCTLGAFGLMNAWQPKITATEAGLIYCVEPIFASLLALFLPALFSAWAGISYANETTTGNLLLGGALITVANIIIQLQPPEA